MFVVRTTENPAYPVRKLVCPEQPVGFDNLAFAVYPFRLYGVEPRAPLGKKATDDPHSAPALLDAAVVPSEPPPHLLGDVPTGVVPEMRTIAFFPALSSFSAHHPRNRVVMLLTGLPSTNLNHVSSSSGR